MATERRTLPGDIVLIHYKDAPTTYARVEAIRDHERDDWFYCDLLVLGVPPGPVSWILRQDQIDGEAFTMGGESVRLARLAELGTYHTGAASAADATLEDGPATEPSPQREDAPRPRRGEKGKVVSLFPRPATDD